MQAQICITLNTFHSPCDSTILSLCASDFPEMSQFGGAGKNPPWMRASGEPELSASILCEKVSAVLDKAAYVH